MSDEAKLPDKSLVKQAAPRTISPTVVRSKDAPPGLPYGDYRKYLRYDFYYSCAYCSMSECEAHGISFEIDHYEPVSAAASFKGTDLNAYENLMYSCEICNGRKSDICPPPEARKNGLRFFRIDMEPRSDHFRLEGNELVGTTEVGRFTIDYVDLNREGLKKLRDIRRNLYEYEGVVSEGIIALANFAIDRLSPEMRIRALAAINKAIATTEKVFSNLDEALIAFAQSDVLVDELSAEAEEKNKERLARIRKQEAMYPFVWRGRKHKGKRH